MLKERDKQKKVAFALGGLAGNNAYGAGFLQAALDEDVTPQMISCTSGQIYWVSEYLKERQERRDLGSTLQAHIDAVEMTPSPDLNLMRLALAGRSEVFKPALPQYLLDSFVNSTTSWTRAAGQLLNLKAPFMLKEWLSVFPARTLIPTFSAEFFETISGRLNSADIGIAFNSYDPQFGVEHIHLNRAAKEQLWDAEKKQHSYRSKSEYRDMTPETVRAGLWLYQYGFDTSHQVIDGAYFRHIMLSELQAAKIIYVVRPLSLCWRGKLPETQLSLEDLKLETAFNGSYMGERDKIILVNKFIKEKLLPSCETTQPNTQSPKKVFHCIELIELEIDTQEGFFDYVFEKMAVFEKARAQAVNAFRSPPKEKCAEV